MRVMLAALAATLTIAAWPAAARAATCDDFSTQAAAQRAANTRDPDDDGVYCENLPCPCHTRSWEPAPAHSSGSAPSLVVRKAEARPLRFSVRGRRGALPAGWSATGPGVHARRVNQGQHVAFIEHPGTHEL